LIGVDGRRLTGAWAGLCAAVVLLASGCASNTEPAVLDVSDVPACNDVWIGGQLLPGDYEGCAGDDGDLVLPALSSCADGSQFTTHEDRLFARLNGTIEAGPEGSPEAATAYARFVSDCYQGPVSTRTDEPAAASHGRSRHPSATKDFETFAGNIFTVTVEQTKAYAAQVRFCATAPYQGGPIPITRGPWGLQDQEGTVWPADEGDAVLRGSVYPVEASVSVGDCLQGWVHFNVPGSTTPVRVVYDSSIGGPFTWDLTSPGTASLPDPPASEPLAAPTESSAYPAPPRDCYTLESAGSPFAGDWLSLASRGEFTDDTVKLQDRLNWLGFGCIPEDGDYGPVTREAVMRFQRAFGLVVDGKVGPQTWEAVFTY
jgi:hypothetical protein